MKKKKKIKRKSKLVLFIAILAGAILGIAFMEQMQIINIFPETLPGVTAYSVGANSVQSYFTFLDSNVNVSIIPFTGGQTGNNAIPFVTMAIADNDTTNDFWRKYLADVYFNDSGIVVQRVQNGPNTNITAVINVVEFSASSVKVQNGTFSLNSASVKSTVVPIGGTSVNTSRTAMVFYYNSTDATDDYADNSIRGNITNSSYLNFTVDSSSTTGIKAGHWYVFESLDGSFTVQNVYISIAGASNDTSTNSSTKAINSVQTNKTFLIGSYISNHNNDDPQAGSFNISLTNSTAISALRASTPNNPPADINATVFVITFTGDEFVQRGTLSYASGVHNAVAIITAVNTSLAMAWNPLLTGRMDNGNTASAQQSAFNYINVTNSTAITAHREESVSSARVSWEVIQWVATAAAADSAPQWSQNSTNSTLAGKFVRHNINWTDDIGLSGYIFSFDNGTGSFTNDSFVTFTGTTNWSNVSKWINTTVGSTIRWRFFANDSTNQFNYTDNFSYVASVDDPPNWSQNSTNATLAGNFTKHSVNWTDDIGLSGYIFSFDNGTGSFTNDSFVTFTGTTNWSNVSKWVNTTLGSVIRWKFFANDSTNQFNYTDNFSYVAAVDIAPNWSQNTANGTAVGTLVKHRVKWTDDLALSGYIFSFDNGTGTFTNDSFVVFSGKSNFSNATKIINTTTGSTIRWRYFANDSANKLNSTSIFSYVTTSPPVFINLTSKLVGFDTTNSNSYNTSSVGANVVLDANKWYTIVVHGYRLGGAVPITSITHDSGGTPLEFTLISGAQESWASTREVEVWAVRPTSTTANSSILIQWPSTQSASAWTLTEWTGVNSTNFSQQVVVNNGSSDIASSVTMASYSSATNAVFFVTAIGGSGSGDPGDDITEDEGRSELHEVDDTERAQHADHYQNPNGGDTTLTANWTNNFDWAAIGIEVLAEANNPPQWSQNTTNVTKAWNTTAAVWDGPNSNFSVTTQDTGPTGISFNSTGTKMFVTGTTNDRVYQYTLSTAWDTTTATWDGPGSNLSVAAQDTGPTGIFFNSTGTKMFLVGNSNAAVYQYTLSQAWNTSTATWDGPGSNLSVAAQDTGPTGIFFNSTGTKMFIVGFANSAIYQYTLSQAWNTSTATWDGPGSNLSVTPDTTPHGIFFNSTGNKMFITGDDSTKVYQYTLSQAWNTSTATYDGTASDLIVAGQDSSPRGIFFNSTGTKMLLIGASNDRVYSYTILTTATPGTFIKHSVKWTDDSALSGYIFSFDNGTGSFTNDSFVTFTGTTNWSNVSKWINTTGGSTIQWYFWANDSTNNVNSTSIFSYITTNTVSNSCTYTSGNWAINCSHYCNITSNVDLNGNNISIIGNGITTITANISNYSNGYIAGIDSTNICTIRIFNGGGLKD